MFQKVNLEVLEDRSVPAVLSITKASGLLTITVDDAVSRAWENKITVSDNGNLIRVTDNINSKSWDYPSVSVVKFIGSKAADRFTGLSNKVSYIVYGNDNNDYIKTGNLNDKIYGGNDNDSLFGSGGDDYIYGGSSSDTLVGGNGNDYLYGESGEDILVSLDNIVANDYMSGGTEQDVIWKDGYLSKKLIVDKIKYDETDILKSVINFTNAIDRTLDGDVSAEPFQDKAPSYTRFANLPLLHYTSLEDIEQGAVGDCWLLSALSSMLTTQEGYKTIRNNIVDFGDGTYGVQLGMNYYRITNRLPSSNGVPVYAKLGLTGGMWVALYEKAFAMYRNGGVGFSYEALSGGQPTEVYTAFRFKLSKFENKFNTTDSLREFFNTHRNDTSICIAFFDFRTGKSLPNSPIINIPKGTGHAYAFTGKHFERDIIFLYNPWGTDGCDKIDMRPNDGYVEIAFLEMLKYNFTIYYGKLN